MEKIEYWAALWGTAITAITGLILWFENFTLAWLPGWVPEAATVLHFLEAIQATLAILVWHFYFVIFDPAVYYGDREADLAMTELFGGFGDAFYRAYAEQFALDDGYKTRKALYNLYHILNHANLFGGGYMAQAAQMMDTLISKVR